MTGRPEGKVALVAGAGSVGSRRGNGRAVAIRFAHEGARLFAVDRDPVSVAPALASQETPPSSFLTAACRFVVIEKG